ncbi:MAG: hypothetical protein HWD60_12945 [Defluviicoccus sp.]|nr:MAG: hypothetical protein HWD60_12945 [Defluviicoccus sp.]
MRVRRHILQVDNKRCGCEGKSAFDAFSCGIGTKLPERYRRFVQPVYGDGLAEFDRRPGRRQAPRTIGHPHRRRMRLADRSDRCVSVAAGPYDRLLGLLDRHGGLIDLTIRLRVPGKGLYCRSDRCLGDQCLRG